MAFYGQFPAIYAYPMPFPANQEFYMYNPHPQEFGQIFYEHGNGGPTSSSGSSPPNHHHHHVYERKMKTGFNNRKESMDSGVSSISGVTRKTSNTSTISNSSIIKEKDEKEHLKESSDSDNAKDAEDEPPYEKPDDDLCEKIVAQVEFYFSDANITKDKFLLKHVKRNKEGFVSLKLISSFKRVKHLTKDWRQVAEAVERKSDKLEVNDLKTKVRRLAELPEYDETVPSRTVVAMNLPLERPTIEGVAEIFSKTGDIVLIRILRPGNPIPADVKPFVNKHPEMTSKVCALVEFERTEFALKAVKELTSEDEDKLTVMELIAPASKSNKNKDANKKKLDARSAPLRRQSYAGFGMQHHQNSAHHAPIPGSNNLQQSNGSSVQPQQSQQRTRRISLYHNMKFSTIDEIPPKQQQQHGLNPNAPTFQMQQRRISRPSFIHPMEMMAMTNPGYPHPQGPWMSRRMFGAECASSGLTLPTNVIRMPRGPTKGSKGFTNWCRNRMTPTQEKQQEKKNHAVPIVAPASAPEAAKKVVPEIVVTESEDPVPEEEEVIAQVAVEQPRPEAADAAPAAGDSVDDDCDEGFSDPDVVEQNVPSSAATGVENERTR